MLKRRLLPLCTLVAACIATAAVGAGDAAAQERPRDPAPLERRVNVALRDAPLAAALDEVARAAQLSLSYSADLLPARRVTLVRESMEAGAALRLLLEGTGLEVSATAGGIVVVAPGAPDARTVHGRIVDAVSGAPLAGVSVALEGTSVEVLTEADGAFMLVTREPGRRLVVRRYGYQSATIAVAAGAAGTPVDVVLSPAALSLDRLDVAGPRVAVAEPDPVHAVTTLRPAELASLQPRTLGEVFRAGAAMLAPADGSPAARLRVTGLRGATSLALSPPKVYLDGVELAQPQYAGVLDPAMVERIEIIRGPQGAALYGSDAIGGVVHIITRKGAPGTRGGTSAEVRSTGGAMEAALGSERAWTADQRVVASFTGARSAATAGASLLRQGATADGGGQRTSGFAGVRAAGRRAALEASVHVADQTWRSVVNDVLRTQGVAQLLPGVDEPQRVQQAVGGATVRFLTADRWSHAVTAGHDHIVLSVSPERLPRLSPPDSLLGEASGTSDRTSLRYTSLLRLPLSGADGALVTFGGELTRLTHRGATASTQRTDAGAFTRLELHLPRLVFSAGVRAEQSSTFGSRHGAAWLPSVGAAYRAEAGAIVTRWRAAWGRAIRPPWPAATMSHTAYELLPNPRLAPEEQTGLELGADFTLPGRGALSITRFEQVVNGLIQNVPVRRAGAAFMPQNVGRIRNTGWEGEASLDAGAFSIRGSHTRVDSRVEQLTRSYLGELLPGDRVPEVPANATSFTLAWTHRDGSIGISGVRTGSWSSYDWLALYRDYAAHAGGLQRPPRTYRTDYNALTRVDIAISHFVTPRLSAVLKLENVGGSRRGSRDNLEPAPGRAMSLGLQWR